MAKPTSKKNDKKKVSKAKPVKSASNKKTTTAKKDNSPKKAKGKVITKKAPKPAAKVKPAANNKGNKKTAPAVVVPASNNSAKGKVVPKAASRPETAKAPVQQTSGKNPKLPKTKEKPVLSPELAALPKLPSHIHYKRGKGKLAPGEKRLVKTEVITHHVIADKPIDEEKKAKAEPKGKYQMEYIMHCPVTLLYDFLSTPSGLQEWFADDVMLKDDVYTFNWDGQLQKAQLLNAKIDSYLRFHWMDKPEGTYVEFRITQDELTGEIALTVTDFGENEDDIITNKRLWDSQIQRLLKVMGAY